MFKGARTGGYGVDKAKEAAVGICPGGGNMQASDHPIEGFNEAQ